MTPTDSSHVRNGTNSYPNGTSSFPNRQNPSQSGTSSSQSGTQGSYIGTEGLFGGSQVNSGRIPSVSDPRDDPQINRRINPRISPQISPRISPRFTPQEDPRFTPSVNLRFTPRSDPRFSPSLNPRLSASTNPRLSHLSPLSSPRIKTQEIHTQIVANAEQVIDVINQHEKRNFKLGAFLLVVAIATWMVGLELVNSVLKGNEFQKPFFMATLTGSCFMLNWIPDLVNSAAFRCSKPSQDVFSESPLLSTSDLDIDGHGSMAQKPNEVNIGASPLERHEVLSLAFQIAIIYFVYNIMGMSALKYTSASNQTILGSTTTFFTLLLGVILQIDRLTSKKVVCVLSSLFGVVLINLGELNSGSSDGNKFKPKNPALGNTFALAGAFCYALYLLVMKIRCGTGERTTNERELFGWVGIFTFFMGIPLLFVVHFLDIERFSLPPSHAISLMVLTNSVFSVISDYVTIIAMLLTSPLVTSLALTSSIPISIFIDFLVLRFSGGSDPSEHSGFFVYAFGVACILTSVLLINIDITSENELIEEVIDGAFEGAIKNDEVLSPVLSPYLSSSTATAKHSPSHKVGLRLLSPRFGFFQGQKESQGHFPEVSRFALNATTSTDSTSLKNANHQHLYTLDSQLSELGQDQNLHISGGVNHNFVVTHNT